jgi:hypothetical protein
MHTGPLSYWGFAETLEVNKTMQFLFSKWHTAKRTFLPAGVILYISLDFLVISSLYNYPFTKEEDYPLHPRHCPNVENV